jgi:hypothetical protein
MRSASPVGRVLPGSAIIRRPYMAVLLETAAGGKRPGNEQDQGK